MKKLLVLLLSTVMLFTFGSKQVFAQATPIAKIGENNYTNLAEAIEYAKGLNQDVTIELLENVDGGQNALDINLDDYIHTITLDLGGHTITGRINLKKGKLKIDNGNVNGGALQPLNVYGSGTEGASNYSVLTIASDATVTGNEFGVCLFGEAYNTEGYGAVVNIYGNVSSTGTGTEGTVFVSGNLGQTLNNKEQNNVINIYDGATVTSTQDTAIALNGNATVNIYDAEITGDTAITVKRGKLNVNGGTIKSTGANNEPGIDNNNGTEMTGAGISVTNTYNDFGPLYVNINGGTIISENGHSIFKEEDTYQYDADITVKGGTFSDLECLKYIDKTATSSNPVCVSLNNAVNNARGISVPEGTNVIVDFNGKTYTVEKPGAGSSGTKTQAFQLLENSNITFTNGTINCTTDNINVTWTSDTTEKGIAMVIQNYANLTLDNMTIDGTNIAHNGTNTRYIVSINSGNVVMQNGTSIEALEGDFAFDSCKFGDYTAPSVVTWDTTINGKIEATGGDITLCEGTIANGPQLRVGENKDGTLVKDSIVTISKGATVNGIVAVFGENVLDVNGNINGYISTNGNAYNGNEVININDGASIESDVVGVYLPNGTLNITGGTIKGTTAVYFKSTNLNITGGTLIATGDNKQYEFNGSGCFETGDALVIDNCNYPHDIGTVAVTGGKFESKNASAIASYKGNNADNRFTGFVSGGIFADHIADDLVVAGKAVVANTDKTTNGKYPFTVGEKKVVVEVDVKADTDDSEVKKAANVEKIEEADITKMVKSDAKLDAEAATLANNTNVINNATVSNALEKVKSKDSSVTNATLKMKVQTYLDMNITNTSTKSEEPTKLNSVTVDITPMFKVVAYGGTINETNAITVEEGKKLSSTGVGVNRTVKCKVYLPSAFGEENARVYVKHKGNVYGLEDANQIRIKLDGSDKYIEFDNPDGFSPFIFSLIELQPDPQPSSKPHTDRYKAPVTGVE